MRHGKPWKPNRRERRILLVLVSGAGNLSGLPICRAAQVGSGTLYPFLARLEKYGWVTSEWENRTSSEFRRRSYTLTPRGRLCALALLRLEDRRGH